MNPIWVTCSCRDFPALLFCSSLVGDVGRLWEKLVTDSICVMAWRAQPGQAPDNGVAPAEAVRGWMGLWFVLVACRRGLKAACALTD